MERRGPPNVAKKAAARPQARIRAWAFGRGAAAIFLSDMKIIEKDNAVLYRYRVDNSTFLINPFEGARLLSWDIEDASGKIRSVVPWTDMNALGGEKMYNTFGGNPIIFPFPSTSFVGRKPDLWRTPRGDVRPMRRHGYAWDGKFEVVEVCENALKMKFIPDADARQAYPYDYNMYVRYQFFQRSFISEIILQNKGDLPMPWGAGFHPYFTIPWVKGETKKNYVLITDAARSTYNVGDGTRYELKNLDKMSFGDTEMLGRILCNLKTGTLKIRRIGGGEIDIVINDNKKPDPSMVVVTWGKVKDGDGDFFAVEPWIAPPNCATKPLQFVDGNSIGTLKMQVKVS